MQNGVRDFDLLKLMDGGASGHGGGGSEGENKNSAEGGEPKVKRKMKTAFQLEILEKTYAGLCFFLIFTISLRFHLTSNSVTS